MTLSNQSERELFEAWDNEIENFATRGERIRDMGWTEALFAAWQAGARAAQSTPAAPQAAGPFFCEQCGCIGIPSEHQHAAAPSVPLQPPQQTAAVQSEPVAWRHSHTHCLSETEEEVELVDGDEWAEPLFLTTPPAADARDAARYRWLRRCRGQEHDPLFTVVHELDGTLWGGDLDFYIDSAMAEKPGA